MCIVLAENDQWRVLEATWQPVQEDDIGARPGDRVSLVSTNRSFCLTRLDGTSRDAGPKAGTAKARTGNPVPANEVKNAGAEQNHADGENTR